MAEAPPVSLGIAIVGAESTGKTTLAMALAEQLRVRTGLRVACVPELLRGWCEAAGRTPLAHEQGSILRAQHERIEQARATHDIVVCDTTALMTAVYSRLLFGDVSLEERAAELHRRHITVTLLTAIDLPWVADGFQRDGPQVREPVDDLLRALLQRHAIPFAVVGGQGPARVAQAQAAVQPWLGGEPASNDTGLFTGLLSGPGPGQRSNTRWACECCPDAASERTLLRGSSTAL